MVLTTTLHQLLFLFFCSCPYLTMGTLRTNFSPFKSIVNAPTFVDKTIFIKEFIRKVPKGRRLVLLTAPKGFGKTTNLDMFRQFFELTVNKINNITVVDRRTTENYKVFSKLAISSHEETMKHHFGQYPVIYMDFATFGDNFAADIIRKVGEIYNHYYILSNGTMKTTRLPDPNKANLTLAMNRLANLARKLRNHFDVKVMLLVDNYEQPILNMVANKATMADIYAFNDLTLGTLIRALPRFVAYTVFTGIHQMLKASLVGGCRHPNSLKFLAEHFAVTYYGFTEEEVTELFDKFKLTKEERHKVAINCNGYRIESNLTSIYNPAPIVKYLNGKRPESEKYLQNYALRTGVIAENLYKFLRMSEVRAHLVGVLWYRKERVAFDTRIWITDFDKLHDVLYTDKKIDFAKTLFFSYLQETGHFHTGGFPNFGVIPNDEIQRQLNAEVRKYYMLKYNMKFDKLIDALTPIVTELQTTDEMLRNLEKALNDIFKPLYATRNDTEGGRFIYPELEFETIIYCAATTRFHFTHGLIEVRLSDQYIRKLQENKVSADVITDTIPGRIDMGILSDDLRIALLIQICHNETLEEGLDAVSDLVPVHYKPQIIKYLAINVNLEYKAEAACLSNHNVSAVYPTKPLPGSDYSSYDVFDRSEVQTERGWMTGEIRKGTGTRAMTTKQKTTLKPVDSTKESALKEKTTDKEFVHRDITGLYPYRPQTKDSPKSDYSSYDVSGMNFDIDAEIRARTTSTPPVIDYFDFPVSLEDK